MKHSSAVYTCLSPLTILASTVFGQVVRWDIQKHHQANGLQTRARTLQSDVSNEQIQGGYFVAVKIGTPGQELSLQLDTGSSDVWVPSNKAPVCVDKTQGGCPFGSFDPDRSRTFDVLFANGFDVSYQDNSSSIGDYFTDKLEISSKSVVDFTMGLGRRTDISFGVIGVGYAGDEASTETADTIYPNLPIAMQEAGIINSAAYSLWLNDLEASTGSILFGGVDTEKYVGNLTRLPIQPENRQFTHFIVSLYSLEATSSSGNDVLTSRELPMKVVLDSGTTLSYLPPDIAAQVWSEVGATYDEISFQTAIIPCSYANHVGNFSFVFSGPDGPRINVAMDELVLPLTTGKPPTFSSGPHSGQAICEFGIQKSSETPWLLGDTFLRSAYVVYDLINNEVGIAPTDFNSTKSNVMVFASKGAAIPSATLVNNSSQSGTQPRPNQTGQSAAKGFQEGSSACSLEPLSVSSSALISMTIAALLMGSPSFIYR
ncbi:Peptidase A1 [Metarhizium album ARSEF 1941]|uniref:Peptidase A1 n=1 Tax=Metarhizium album (strain ARSEF 1941) TaxID=1081103 RepID=A0A0B2WVQ3_METAS|nr:Peptidase A1 [Metarhizium album ARSEF 1941]KHN97694.1 Peptidase A1 [Metarhizium album ARSEF 1941]